MTTIIRCIIVSKTDKSVLDVFHDIDFHDNVGTDITYATYLYSALSTSYTRHSKGAWDWSKEFLKSSASLHKKYLVVDEDIRVYLAERLDQLNLSDSYVILSMNDFVEMTKIKLL